MLPPLSIAMESGNSIWPASRPFPLKYPSVLPLFGSTIQTTLLCALVTNRYFCSGSLDITILYMVPQMDRVNCCGADGDVGFPAFRPPHSPRCAGMFGWM